MEIRFKSITHERTEDAPFIGALISAVDCKFKCTGCCNKDWKKEPTFKLSAEEIIEKIISNPLNQGIIFGGLEWSLQAVELLELSKLASQNGLQVMIYTGCEDLTDFFTTVGRQLSKTGGYKGSVGLLSKVVGDGMFDMVGRMTFDYFIPDAYYIKTGKYDAHKLVDNNIEWGVKLASSNQRLCKIEKARDL